MKTKLYYLKERHNPQFKKPYYVKLGQMSKTAANKYANSLYGINCILSYNTEKEYNDAIEKLKTDGFKVH